MPEIQAIMQAIMKVAINTARAAVKTISKMADPV